MEINIFDRYDENTEKLITSLKTSGINRKNLFVHYEGYLPTGSMSPYTFFTSIEKVKENKQRLFFNQVSVPDFYDIRHIDAVSANIEYLKNIHGKVNYFQKGYRLVDNVVWFSMRNSTDIVKKDYYNSSGIKYASVYFSDSVPYKKEYYNMSGEVVISENLISKAIKLYHDYKIYLFENITQFFIYFLKISQIDVHNVYINSLSFPLFISRALNIRKQTTLFWQEELGKEIPGNMKNELKKATALKRIVFMEEKQLDYVKKSFPDTEVKLDYLSHIGEFVRKNKYRKCAFILTNSDNIYGLEDILTNFPDLKITVAAHTNMSLKLLNMEEKFENIQLIPSINEQELKKELEKSDIYLDINRGTKVGDILKRAYRQNMIILSYKEVVKSGSYGLIFTDVRDLCNHLSYIFINRINWNKLLKKMVEKNGPMSTIGDYQKVLGYKES